MGFQRAARTDKGVSAVANLISLKCVPLTNLTELVNEQLPKQIRMFGKRPLMSVKIEQRLFSIRNETCGCQFQ